MNDFKKILVPVDLSQNAEPAIALATTLAVANKAKLILCYVALPPLPPQAMHGKDELDAVLLREHAEFKNICPTDLTIEYEHLFLRGNPAPEILKAVAENGCDLIVMTTHGRSGFTRWLLGSVAEYLIRNATCPVITVKMPPKPVSESQPKSPSKSFRQQYGKSPFVTSAMEHVRAIHECDEMADVVVELKAAGATSAPVVDENGVCIGILTTTDIEHYYELQKRLENHDKSVLEEVFETDEFGLRRPDNAAFHQVRKHMTAPVITISAHSTCTEAQKKFSEKPDIHHLIVVDDQQRPLGVVEPAQLEELNHWDLDSSISLKK